MVDYEQLLTEFINLPSTFTESWYLFLVLCDIGGYYRRWDLLHAVQSYDMAAVDFKHHENPPTWAVVEPATLGREGQRQTNHATQPTFLILGEQKS
ncbi:hypothetical protein TNCV_261351 [Trichonephila clavipes]|nr:hypothetical protein TNCV_261351 [Trichonephila clavipes]